MTDSKGRKVFDAESESLGVDSYFTKAYYEDGSLVPHNELDYLTDTYPDVLSENALHHAIMGAEAYFEGDR